VENNFSDLKLNNFTYTLIPGDISKYPSLLSFHNYVYNYWKIFWDDVFLKNGSKTTINSDSFRRQNIISVIQYNEEIVGMHLYSLYNLQSFCDLNHSYISKSYNEMFINYLKENSLNKLMSLEFLTVNNQWRKSKYGFSVAELIANLSLNFLNTLDAQCSVAPSRSDVGVTDLSIKLGAKVICENVNMHNTPCDLIIFLKNQTKESRNERIKMLTNILWRSRLDYTGFTKEHQTYNTNNKVTLSAGA
jgi:hypothetical protein